MKSDKLQTHLLGIRQKLGGSTMTPDEKAAGVLETLIPGDETDRSLLVALVRFVQACNLRAQRDFGMARAVGIAGEVCSSLGLNWDMNRFLETLPSESRRYLDAMAEALEIYGSIHVSDASTILDPNDAALAELRRIREICLEPIASCRY